MTRYTTISRLDLAAYLFAAGLVCLRGGNDMATIFAKPSPPELLLELALLVAGMTVAVCCWVRALMEVGRWVRARLQEEKEALRDDP